MTQPVEDIGSDIKQLTWLLAGLVVVPLILIGISQRLGLSPETGKLLFAALAVLVALVIARLHHTVSQHAPHDAVLTEPEGVRSAAIATKTMPAALLLGLAGVIAGMGYDALAYILGIAGGLFLMTLMAGGLKRSPGQSLPEVVAVHFQSQAVGLVAAIAAALALLLLLTAELKALALAGTYLLALDTTQCILIASFVIFLGVLASQMARPASVSSSAYLLILAGFLAPAIWLAWTRYGMPVPHAPFPEAVAELTRLETDLIVKKLADPRTVAPATLPFQSFDTWSFASLVVLISAGVSVFPHFVAHLLPAKNAGEARRSAARGLLYATVFLVSVPVLAILGKLFLLSEINRPVTLAAPPAWVSELAAQDGIKICASMAREPAALAEACAKVAGHKGQLRVQDLNIPSDRFLLALPAITGMPLMISGVFGAAVLLAGLIAGPALVRAVQSVVYQHRADGTKTDLGPVGLTAIGVFVIVPAAVLALNTSAGLIDLFAGAAAVLAATLFPVLAIANPWPRATAAGAVTGVLIGLVAALAAVASVLLPVTVQDIWTGFSGDSTAAAKTFQSLKQAWEAAPAGETRAAAWQTLEAHARTMPLWFGLKSTVAAIVALPLAALSLILVSLFTRPGERT